MSTHAAGNAALIVAVRTPRARQVSLEARSIKGRAGVNRSRTTSGLERNVIHSGLLMNPSLGFDNVPDRGGELPPPVFE